VIGRIKVIIRMGKKQTEVRNSKRIYKGERNVQKSRGRSVRQYHWGDELKCAEVCIKIKENRLRANLALNITEYTHTSTARKGEELKGAGRRRGKGDCTKKKGTSGARAEGRKPEGRKVSRGTKNNPQRGKGGGGHKNSMKRDWRRKTCSEQT